MVMLFFFKKKRKLKSSYKAKFFEIKNEIKNK